MYLESREHISGVPQLLVEVMIGVGRRARLEALIGSLVEYAAYGSIELWLYLRLYIELLSVDVTEGPYKQVLIELQTGSRCVVRIEVGLIDYQSKRAPRCGALAKKARRWSFSFELCGLELEVCSSFVPSSSSFFGCSNACCRTFLSSSCLCFCRS